MPGRLDFELQPSRSTRRAADAPCCRILVLADLRADAQRPPLAERSLYPIAHDTLDRACSLFAPQLKLSGQERLPALSLDFRCIDDFHPDALLARVPLFAQLAQAAPQLAAALPAAATPSRPAQEDNPFAALLGGDIGEAARRGADDFIRKLLGPVGTPAADPRHQVLGAAADLARAQLLRALLHEPRLQRLEAAWRGLGWLLAELDADAGTQVDVFELSREELAADLMAPAPCLPGLFSAAAEAGAPYAMIVCDFGFAASREDVLLLAALGGMADALGAPLLAGFDPQLAADPAAFAESEGATLLHALARTPGAARLGLALPRLLLRRPYGKRSDPLDTLDFEEIDADWQPCRALWGSPAWGLALLIGRGFLAAEGWDFSPDNELELLDLPLALYPQAGDVAMLPCAERFLSDAAAEAIDALGLMPLISRRERNAVRLFRFRSLAGALRGRWRG